METTPKQNFANLAFVVGAAFVIALAIVAQAPSAESTTARPMDRAAVAAHFFPDRAPDWAGVEKRSLARAHATGQLQPRELDVTDAIVLRQAKKTQTCVADRLGDATFTEPKITQGRVDWTFRVASNSSKPDPVVYKASRDCNEAHFQYIERALLAREMPKGQDWFAMRDGYLTCVGSGHSVEALVNRLATPGSEALFEQCAKQYSLLFELP